MVSPATQEPKKLTLQAIDSNLTKPSSKQIHGRRFSNVAPVVASSIVFGLGVASLASLAVIVGLVHKGILVRSSDLFAKIYFPIRIACPLLLFTGGLLTIFTSLRCANNRSVIKQLNDRSAKEIPIKYIRTFLVNFQCSSYKREYLSASEQAVLSQLKKVYQDEIKLELDVPHNEFVTMIGNGVSRYSNRSYISEYWFEHIVMAELHEGKHEFTAQQQANMTYLRTQLNIPAVEAEPEQGL